MLWIIKASTGIIYQRISGYDFEETGRTENCSAEADESAKHGQEVNGQIQVETLLHRVEDLFDVRGQLLVPSSDSTLERELIDVIIIQLLNNKN